MRTLHFTPVARGTFVGFCIVDPAIVDTLRERGRPVTTITDIPAACSAREVARLVEQTTNATWVGKQPGPDGERGRSVFAFSELGVGKIIRD